MTLTSNELLRFNLDSFYLRKCVMRELQISGDFRTSGNIVILMQHLLYCFKGCYYMYHVSRKTRAVDSCDGAVYSAWESTLRQASSW